MKIIDTIENIGAYHRKICVCLPENATVTQIIYFHAAPGDGRSLAEKLWEKVEPLFTSVGAGLVMLEVEDWNRDLSPWWGERILPKEEDFAGEAKQYLQDLSHEVIPQLESRYFESLAIERRMIGGYSMGGLFALYALLESAVFTDMISVSGSLWYDGLIEYVTEKVCGEHGDSRTQKGMANVSRIFEIPKTAYLSLGQREPRVRNARMKRVGEQTGMICDIMEKQGYHVYFQWNQGSHFQDELARIERAFRFMVDREN